MKYINKRFKALKILVKKIKIIIKKFNNTTAQKFDSMKTLQK